MYGWRAKIGLITPMSENVEHAFHIYAPEGVSFASTKISYPADSMEVLTDRVGQAAAMYQDYDVDLVVFGCTSGEHVLPFAQEQACAREIERVSGRACLSAGAAVLDALQALGARKVAVMTPYSDAANEREKEFLESNGYEVTTISNMDVSYVLNQGYTLEACDEYLLYRNALKLDLNGADALYLSCMGLTTLELINDLETVLGVPVITGQQAALWGALRRSRVGAKPEKLGKLFSL